MKQEKSSSFKYLLFDLDGTLTNPEEGITKCVRYALKHYGIEVDDLKSLHKFIGPPMNESFHDFYGFDSDKAMEATRKFRERYNVTGWKENYPLEGVQDLLLRLKQAGFRLAVATSKPEPTAIKVLHEFELDKYFEVIAGADPDCESTKAAVIEKCLRRLNVTDRSEAVMIGDRRHDIEGAKKCGLASIGLYVGFAPRGELEEYGADYVFENFGELESFLVRSDGQ